MNRLRLWLLLGTTLGLGVSCGGGEDLVEPPVPGTLSVNLVTPYSDDGALLLSIQGPEAPTAIRASAGLRLFTSSAAPSNSNAVVVVGPISSGALLTLTIPDVSHASEFIASIHQGASPSYAVRSSADYSLSVSQ